MTYEDIPISLIDRSWSVLRKVRTETEEFQGLKASIKQEGIQAPILVRRIKTKDGDIFSLIDGNHRLTAAEELGFTHVPCAIRENCSDRDAVNWQMQMNIHRVSTSKAELARQVSRLYYMDDGMSQAQLARLLGKSIGWVKQVLDFDKLPEDIQYLVDTNEIKFGNALLLKKAPEVDLPKLISAAKTETLENFEQIVNQKIKERREHNAGGKAPTEWEPTPKRRKLSEVQAAATKPPDGILDGINDVKDAFAQGVLYSISMDEATKARRKEEQNRVQKAQKAREAQIKLQKLEEERAELEKSLKELEESLND